MKIAKHKAIVCVDDEKIILTSLTAQLRERFGEKYIYETAMSGEEALEVIDDLIEGSVSVILIISDWLMNGMKGDELLMRIKRKNPRIVKVMLTGQADMRTISKIAENNALDAFFSKPWEKNNFMNKLDSLLSKAECTGAG